MATKKKSTTKKTSRSSTKSPTPRTKRKASAKKAEPKPERKRTDWDARLPKVGTVLTRTYKGKEITATVVEGGLEYEGAIYKSVSGLARHIVGYQISGPVFFKLTGQPEAE